MRRVELDYLIAPRPPVWPGLVLLVISVGVAGELFTRYRDTQAELARLELASGLAGVPRRAAPALSKERLDAETKSAETVVRQLALPWAALIQAIEQAATKDVAILQLQPDAETRSVRLVAEAKTREAMFQYLRRLGSARALSEVHVVSHQVQRDDPQRPIQFSVLAALGSTAGSAR